MRKWSIILFSASVLVSLVLFPSRVAAQNALTLKSLEVDLWPEYDRASVLVIYHITLPATATLPVELTIRIPASAGDPNAVAVKQGGQLFQIAYNRQVSGEWGVLKFTATMPEVQLEYYDPDLVKQGALRNFTYHWPGDYAVDSLVVQVQQPLGATNLTISPGLGSGVTGPDGLVYYTAQIGSMPADQAFELSFNYQKTTDALSTANLPVQPGATGTTAGVRNQLLALLPWILAALGVILITGGGVWYWQSGKGKSRPQAAQIRRRRRPANGPEMDSGSVPESEDYNYCHQCGKRAGPNDRFCRACGTRLRTE